MGNQGRVIDLFEAMETFVDHATFELVRKGDLLRADHPLLRRHASRFRPTAKVRFDVEQATAAPGQSR